MLLNFLATAQGKKDSVFLKIDGLQALEPRALQDDLNQRYNGKEFDYTVADGETQNLLQRAITWFFNLLRDTFGFNIPTGALQIFEYVIYFLMGGLAIYLLAKFFIGENLSSLFTKKAKPIVDIYLSEEHIENLDLDVLVQSALSKKNYRLAIRYGYLKILKQLSQKDIIDWHYEKTNLDYQKEIRSPKIRSRFKEVSYLYDHIWYGEQVIDETGYNAANQKFVALKHIVPQ